MNARVAKSAPFVSTHRPVAALAGTVGGFLLYALMVDSPSAVYYLPISVVIGIAIVWLDRQVTLTQAVRWGLVGIAIGNLAGGVLLVGGDPLYQLDLIGSIRYDKVFHAAATGVGAWAAFEVLTNLDVRRPPLLASLAALIALGGGAVVEVVEYFGSQILTNANVGGYTNNMEDLVANLLGAIVGAAVTSRRYARGQI